VENTLPIYEPSGFALQIFKDRYAISQDEGFQEACRRVANFMASAEDGEKIKEFEKKFYEILSQNRLVPGGRIFRGAGRKKSAMLNCFVVKCGDSREEWAQLLYDITVITSLGGGVGCNFSSVRPRGTPIKGSGGTATGAVSLMKMVDGICNELREGGGRRCLPKGSLIHTYNGLIKIENIKIGDIVQTGLNKYDKVIASERTGNQEIVLIDTQMGIFKSSLNHRWATLKNLTGKVEWKLAKDLIYGDRILFIPEEIQGHKTKLPEYNYIKPKMSTTCKDITIPTLDTEIAWLFGYLHGNGCVEILNEGNKGTVSFSCPYDIPEIHNRIVKNIKRFGDNLHINDYFQTKEKCSKPRVCSKQLAEYLSQFKLPHQTMNVPDFILQGLPEIRKAYLAGLLDADGYLGKTKKKTLPKIASSVYPDFLRQIRAVLSSLGIVSKTRLDREATGEWKDMYSVAAFSYFGIEKIKNDISPYSLKYARDGIQERKKEQFSLTVPRKMLREYNNRGNFSPAYWTDLKNSEKAKMECSWKKFILTEGDRDFLPIKVLSITRQNEKEETYDIQIEHDAKFISEGLLVHNSALMFCLRYDHGDIEEFLRVKLDEKELNNANISVLIDDKFLDLVEKDKDIILEWAGKEIKTVKAKWLYDKIIENSLSCGDPGILSIGNADKYNNIWWVAPMSSTNPCGEQWLPVYDACTLGSINLSVHVTSNDEINWDLLDDTIRMGVRFLDNVLDKNEYPLEIIKKTCQNHRRIGLGILGLHDMFLKMGIKYSSEEALKITDKIMLFIKKKAYEASVFLGVEKGSFPLLDRKKFLESGFCKECLTISTRKKILSYGIRNCAILSIQPTGTTSIVAGCSSGIEPLFSPVYRRNFNKHKDIHSKLTNKSTEIVIHPLLKEFIEKGKDYSHFEGAHEISPEQHCKIQSICQKHIDGAISKTINLPKDTTKNQLSNLIKKYMYDLKGISIFRDGSKGESPLMPLPTKEAEKYLKEITTKVESTDNSCLNGKCSLE